MVERESGPSPREGKGRSPNRRFAQLPKRVEPADMVESVPQPPQPEPGYDENVDAIRWYGIPL
ncbi:MAG TPA: hypothetical protein VMT88_01645 [Actinomycetes bacterium]|nr:hypothetical protein [Actinomycetes bacterium]